MGDVTESLHPRIKMVSASAKVHHVILKDSMRKAIYLLPKLDTHMRGYPAEMDRGTIPLEGIQGSLTINKEIHILEEKHHNMNNIQFCLSRGQVCRELPGHLSVNVVIGRSVTGC
ncbi:hypothetical protein E2C01_008321 [Portunus trituberculatus]|uniref:Uncharacterized protein n=1 Tax=Portunus trituberculatus TaxID=210409 RepID=A0A5B7D4E4_PORTR|nr:hypothetical protein [Portunus trituberculatus]